MKRNPTSIATMLMLSMALFTAVANAQSPLVSESKEIPPGNTDAFAGKGTHAQPSIRAGAPALAPEPVAFSAIANSTINVNGYGNYCSKTWPGGGSAFGYVSNGGDPCGHIDPNWTGSMQRKGLYSTSGWNDVVLKCDQGTWFWTGKANAPLDWAYDTAYKSAGKSNCVFTVSPRYMPIFNSPIDNLAFPAGSGFDFAKAPYTTLDVTQFKQPGSTKARKVDFKGRDESASGSIDDHAGYDWGVPKGTKVRAVAAGLVISAETYFKTRDSCNKVERHVFIQHKVCGAQGYCEEFVSYYTHLDSISVNVNDTVQQGDLIGSSGNSGCVPDHLHFSVFRVTNTASSLSEPLKFTDEGTNPAGLKINAGVLEGYNFAIDPYGWYPISGGPDPWGVNAYPKGALSIRLWTPLHTPSPGKWGF